MSNMGYCRFENTLADLEDCDEHLLDELSESESEARRRIIDLCRSMVERFDELEEQL